MTPAEVLSRVLEAGGKVIPDPTRPRLLVPPPLKRLVEANRQALRRLVEYRETLRHWWTLTAQGPQAYRDEIARTYQEILRLHDEVGSPTATRLLRQWAREWWYETKLCPWCGEPGEHHDPASATEADSGGPA